MSFFCPLLKSYADTGIPKNVACYFSLFYMREYIRDMSKKVGLFRHLDRLKELALKPTAPDKLNGNIDWSTFRSAPNAQLNFNDHSNEGRMPLDNIQRFKVLILLRSSEEETELLPSGLKLLLHRKILLEKILDNCLLFPVHPTRNHSQRGTELVRSKQYFPTFKSKIGRQAASLRLITKSEALTTSSLMDTQFTAMAHTSAIREVIIDREAIKNCGHLMGNPSTLESDAMPMR